MILLGQPATRIDNTKGFIRKNLKTVNKRKASGYTARVKKIEKINDEVAQIVYNIPIVYYFPAKFINEVKQAKLRIRKRKLYVQLDNNKSVTLAKYILILSGNNKVEGIKYNDKNPYNLTLTNLYTTDKANKNKPKSTK